MENMDRRANSDLMTKLQNPVIFFQIKWAKCMKYTQTHTNYVYGNLIFQAHKNHFQSLFKENWQFSRQIEKSNTF